MEAPSSRPKILIVDDNPENIRTLMETLSEDYLTIPAKNGPTAIKKANKHPLPDLILLDILMPEIDGYEVCRRLKSEADTKTIPIIFVSALSEAMDETKAFQSGAVDYIIKPFHPETVKARVKTHIELKRHKEDLEELVRKRTGELRASEEKFRGIFENALEGIYQTTPEGRFVAANQSAAILFGYESPEELINSITDIGRQCYFDPGERERQMAWLEKEGQIIGLENHYFKKDGSLVWVSESIRVVRDENQQVLYYEGIVDDITKKKKLSEDLAKAKKAIEEANKAKGDFLMNMNHELKTPLYGMLVASELLSTSDTKDKIIEIQEIIRTSGNSLLKMIERILDFTHSKTGGIEIEAVPFKLDQTLDQLNTRFFHKGKTIQLFLELDVQPEETPNQLVGDAKRLSEIINHLLENAAKFTEKPTKAKLTVRALDVSPADVLLEFSLTDYGIGIAPDQFDKIFEPFYQIDATSTRRYDGVGIGLAICKQLVELMNGEICLKSELGKGSTFIFTIRFKRY